MARINIGRARLVIVVIILALVILGTRIGHRNLWLRKRVRETEQEIVDDGFKLVKLESPIGPQLEAPISIDTLYQFIEEAKTLGAETIYFLPHQDRPCFYLGRKGSYLYSYELDIDVEARINTAYTILWPVLIYAAGVATPILLWYLVRIVRAKRTSGEHELDG